MSAKPDVPDLGSALRLLPLGTGVQSTTAFAANSIAVTVRSTSCSGISWRSAVLGMVAMAGYLSAVVGANVTSAHWPPLIVGGLWVPAGTLFAGVSLTARDLVHEALGPRWPAAGIALGTGLSAVLASPQIAVASAVAFIGSEVLDTLVYARLRHRTRLGAIGVSNAVGLVVDSALFIPLAFGSFAAVPGQILGKTAATTLTLLALHTASIARRAARS